MEQSFVRIIIDKCRKGDRSAQKKLYDYLAPKMFAVCLRYMGDRMPAEDILQDGFITLFSKLDIYSGEGSFEGWARKIFVNTALMSLRKTDALKLSDDLEEAGNLSSDISTQIQNIGYKEIMKIVMNLPDGYRTVFNMFVVEGFSHKEIAQALNISEVTSRSQLQRARMILQEKIKKL
ncbi:MAG: RNA polymerase sigma factor [Candidatus Cryptobacteroides sp.]